VQAWANRIDHNVDITPNMGVKGSFFSRLASWWR
jgi:hypothetical protein